MTKQDLKQISTLLGQLEGRLDQKLDEKLAKTESKLTSRLEGKIDDKIDGLDKKFDKKLSTTKEELITEFCQVIEENISPQFAAVHEEIDWIKNNMVTKSDLNQIMARSDTEYNYKFGFRDHKFNNAIKRLGRKKVFTKQEVEELQIPKVI